ncbi:MAG: hypothetical protein ACJ76Z_07305, partial [Thermoleophilaceae bacterium]
MRRTAVALSLLAFASAPAVASAATGWYDAGAAAPSSASFTDVATADGVVIAVGDAASAPVVYRLAGGAWHSDVVPLPDLATGGASLRAVAITKAAAWAVGSWTEGTPTQPGAPHPLLVRLGAPGLAATQPATWSEITPGSLTAKPSAIALEDTTGTSGATAAGVIGTAGGDVYRVFDSGFAGMVGDAMAPDVGSAGAMGGVAVYGAGAGYAVGSDAVTAAPRFFRFGDSATTLTSEVGLTQDSVTLGAVAALDATHAIAIDGSRYWETDGTSWTRRATVTGILRDVAIADVAGHTVEALAGDDGGGAVWRRRDSGAWTRDTIAGGHPAAVAIAATGDLWAAGGDGLLLHYYDKPAPVTNDPVDGGSQPQDPPPPNDPPPGGTPDPAGDPAPADAAPAPAVDVTVSQPPPAPVT